MFNFYHLNFRIILATLDQNLVVCYFSLPLMVQSLHCSYTYLCLGCSDVNVKTNSWNGNVQGTIKITLTEDVSEYQINFQTDVPLANVQVNYNQIFN